MIEFPENYFDEEERCGFTISRMMKCAWAAQMEVLMRIAEICERHQLTYFAYFGTLLGAVRHRGFIPWDDDMDIAMKRDDYIKFLIYAQEELPEGYGILNPYTEKDWQDSFSRVVNGRNVNTTNEWLKMYHGCPFAVGIDIFPLDYVPRDSNVRNMQEEYLQIAKNSFFAVRYLMENGENDLGTKQEVTLYKQKLAQDLNKLGNFTGIQRDKAFSLSNWILQMYDAICMLCDEENADTIGSHQIHMQKMAVAETLKSNVANVVHMNFETIEIDIPNGYEEILHKSYGDFRKLKISPYHDYPFYSKQISYLDKKELWSQEELEKEENYTVTQSINKFEKGEKTLPDKWKEKINIAKQEGKTIVLFETSLVDFHMDAKNYLNILNKTLKEANKLKESLFIWWRPDKVEKSIWLQKNPKLLAGYNVCKAFFEKNELGLIDETAEVNRAVNNTDVFYGDRGVAYERYRETDKLCWIQQFDLIDMCKIKEKLLYEKSKLSRQWVQRLEINNISKKLLLYNISLSKIVKNKEIYLKKIKNIISISASAYPDLIIYLFVYKDVIHDDEIQQVDVEKILQEIKENIIAENIIIGGGEGAVEEIEKLIPYCNGCYGDNNGISQLCRKCGIPIMIQDTNIISVN